MKSTKSGDLVLRGFHWDTTYLNRNSPRNGRITFLSLETDPICNAKCLYCFSGPELGKFPNNSLTLEEYKNIIKQAKELGAKTISFPGIGEPTLDKNLKPLIEFINKIGFISVIYTNGFIEKDMADFFYKNNVSLIVKIDSLNKERFERLVGLPFEIYKKRLNYLVNLYESGIEKKDKFSIVRLAANTVVTYINKEDIKEIADFCKSSHIKYFVAELAKVGDAKKNWGILTKGQTDDLYKIAKKYNTWISSAILDNRCGLFSHGITIDVNGDLVGCPTARWIRLGNTRKSSLKDLIKIYRQKVYSEKEHYCLARELSLKESN